MAEIQEKFKTRKVYKEGRLVHRTEPDLKTHTSYLVFAVLPREWTDKDEAAVEASGEASSWRAGRGRASTASESRTWSSTQRLRAFGNTFCESYLKFKSL